MFKALSDIIAKWLLTLHVDEKTAYTIAGLSDFIIIVFIAFFLYYLVKKAVSPILKRIAKRTEAYWDDAIIKCKLVNRISLLIPFLIVYHSIPVTLSEFPQYLPLLSTLLSISFIIIFILIFNAALNSAYTIYQETKYSLYHPIKGFIQVGKIIIFIIGFLLVLSVLFNQPLKYMFTGLGAFSAVLLLVFKDPILGFVGGIQISANDMVRQGDWITMSKYGADGTVKEISLTTVKVENFDNTITTLPTYSLVSDSFQNYRNMFELGLRRIKRTINIDISSVKFCTEEDIQNFKKITILQDYINETEQSLEAINKEIVPNSAHIENRQRQTNIGIFRAYLEKFISTYPTISKEDTILVRHLQPTEKGIPIEVYVFTTQTEWIKYEKIQADIFDHILAIIPAFGLKVFQSPTGEDLKNGISKYALQKGNI